MEKAIHVDSGPIGKTLLAFALPVLAAQVLQELYNAADCAVLVCFLKGGQGLFPSKAIGRKFVFLLEKNNGGKGLLAENTVRLAGKIIQPDERLLEDLYAAALILQANGRVITAEEVSVRGGGSSSCRSGRSGGRSCLRSRRRRRSRRRGCSGSRGSSGRLHQEGACHFPSQAVHGQLF